MKSWNERPKGSIRTGSAAYITNGWTCESIRVVCMHTVHQTAYTTRFDSSWIDHGSFRSLTIDIGTYCNSVHLSEESKCFCDVSERLWFDFQEHSIRIRVNMRSGDLRFLDHFHRRLRFHFLSSNDISPRKVLAAAERRNLRAEPTTETWWICSTSILYEPTWNAKSNHWKTITSNKSASGRLYKLSNVSSSNCPITAKFRWITWLKSASRIRNWPSSTWPLRLTPSAPWPTLWCKRDSVRIRKFKRLWFMFHCQSRLGNIARRWSRTPKRSSTAVKIVCGRSRLATNISFASSRRRHRSILIETPRQPCTLWWKNTLVKPKKPWRRSKRNWWRKSEMFECQGRYCTWTLSRCGASWFRLVSSFLRVQQNHTWESKLDTNQIWKFQYHNRPVLHFRNVELAHSVLIDTNCLKRRQIDWETMFDL